MSLITLPGYRDALAVALDLIGDTDPNSEYARGQIQLLAALYVYRTDASIDPDAPAHRVAGDIAALLAQTQGAPPTLWHEGDLVTDREQLLDLPEGAVILTTDTDARVYQKEILPVSLAIFNHQTHLWLAAGFEVHVAPDRLTLPARILYLPRD